ncbi:hypothetical protein [Serratia sp. JSRIV004]|uniref:hypothetical protein n=1 Tax=Serratia sp. JSRIV004 TaxID=2831895 RepID=UPI001CC170D8|nr:hypothetical protein [Serratia sp. JSRIV004]UAN58912.1 hypothetical protein KGP21_07655 [Serratia sp. JSRIV004]
MNGIDIYLLGISVLLFIISIAIMFFVIRKATQADEILGVLKNMSNGIADQLDLLKEIKGKTK